MYFKKKQNCNTQRKNKRKKIFFKINIHIRVLDAFESKIFPIKIEVTGFSDKVLDHFNIRMLAPKKILQRLPIDPHK